MIRIAASHRVERFTAKEARDELRKMAISLLDSKGQVKSGYLQMLNRGDDEALGTRWTWQRTDSTQRALHHVEGLVSKACEGQPDVGEALKQALQAYTERKGERLGTQSFMKLVQVIDRLDEPEHGLTRPVFNVALKENLTLQTRDAEHKFRLAASRQVEMLTPEQGEQVLEGLGNGLEQGSLFAFMQESGSRMREEGMVPEVKFSLPNGAMFLSKVKRKDDRLYAQAIIALNDGTKSSVTAYQSNSQGVWRLTVSPGPGHIHKGPGEQFMTLDSAIQKHLHSQVPAGSLAVELRHLCVTDCHEPEDYASQATRALMTSNAPKLSTYSAPLTPPGDLKVEGALKPNFGVLIDTYKVNLPLTGLTNFFVYASEDESCEYIMAQGEDGRAWVAHAGPKNAAYSASGFPRKGVDFAELTSPLWEYHEQLAFTYRSTPYEPHPKKESYYLNWRYVKEIPLIQAWYQSRGEAMPT